MCPKSFVTIMTVTIMTTSSPISYIHLKIS